MNYTGFINVSNLTLGKQTIEESIFTLCESYNFQEMTGYIIILIVNIIGYIYIRFYLLESEMSRDLNNNIFNWVCPIPLFNALIMIVLIARKLLI